MTPQDKIPTAPGRYPRGEETKQRIIGSAIEIFGRQGYAGTSTRDIAAAASVNTPAIQYYFNGKLGLYNACIDQLSGMAWAQIEPAIAACRTAIAADAPLDQVIARLGDVQDRLLDSFFVNEEGAAIRRLLAWEDAENEANMSEQLMRDRLGMPLIETFRRVIVRATGDRLQPVEVDMHALALMGLSMFFHFNQCRVMDMLEWTVDQDFVARLKVVAHTQLRLALEGLARGTQPH